MGRVSVRGRAKVSYLGHHFEHEGNQDHMESAGRPQVAPSARRASDMSVVKKLNLAVFGNTLVLAALAVMILTGMWYYSEAGRELKLVATVDVQIGDAGLSLANAVDALENAQAAKGSAERQREVSVARDAVDRTAQILDNPEDLADGAMPMDVANDLDRFRMAVVALRTQFDGAPQTNDNLGAIRREGQTLRKEMTAYAFDFHAKAEQNSDEVFAGISNFLAIFIVATAMGIILSFLASRHIIRDVTGMIRRLTHTMERVAAGETETKIPGADRNDEIGEMARSLEVFRRSSLELRDLNQKRAREVEEQLIQQKQVAEHMRELKIEKSRLLENLADGFEVSLGELITSVSAASEQLKATSVHMVAVADGSSEQADSASSAMKRASTNVTAAAAATDEFALSINEISRQATASATLARDATTLVASANTRMNDLSTAADEVGEIAGLIQTIAQRTNLLALNASIEAARGGEAGRGFAVVASEVKELAMQTSAATSSVAEKLTAMQDSTQSSAGDLNSIHDQIGELEKVAVVIATAVDQQSVSGEELARNIDTVAEGSRQVSERLVSLREASEETGTAANDVVASANALGKHANDLRDKAGRFIADVRRSARDLEADEQAA